MSDCGTVVAACVPVWLVADRRRGFQEGEGPCQPQAAKGQDARQETVRQQRLARRLGERLAAFGRRSTPSHFTKATDTRNTLYVLRWKRAVQSLDTMAVVHAGQESEPKPAAPAVESAASSQAEGGKKTKVSIDMDEL